MSEIQFRFAADFDFRPLPGQTVAYRSGMEVAVSEVCAQAAEAAGAGERVQGDDGSAEK